MAHKQKIAAHHALMGITMVVFAMGASVFGPAIMRTKAANEGVNSKQRDEFVVMCKDKYVERLNAALKEANSQPGVRRALEGYWKEMNACILYSIKQVRTASGSDMKGKREEEMKRKQGSGTVLTDEQRKKVEEFRTKPTGSPSTTNTNGTAKPEFKFRNSATPKPGETPKPKPTHNGVDQI